MLAVLILSILVPAACMFAVFWNATKARRAAILVSAVLLALLFAGQTHMFFSKTNYTKYTECCRTPISKLKILEEVGPIISNSPLVGPKETAALRARVIRGQYDEGGEIIILLFSTGSWDTRVAYYDTNLPLYYVRSSYIGANDKQRLIENMGKNVWVTIHYSPEGEMRPIGEVKTFWESRQGVRLLSIIAVNAILSGLILVFRKRNLIFLLPVIVFLGFSQLVFYGFMNISF